MTKAALRSSLVATLFLGLIPIAAFGGSISTTSKNGETLVVWNGREVFREKVDGGVKSKAAEVDGKELAAVVSTDGKVLWESEAGAAGKLQLIEPQAAVPAEGKGIRVETADGHSTVTYRGKKVWEGKTKGKVVGKVKAIDGNTYAAAFDDDRVLWENVRGAAKKVGRPAVGR